jgi:hypothetical protein
MLRVLLPFKRSQGFKVLFEHFKVRFLSPGCPQRLQSMQPISFAVTVNLS